MSRSTLHHRLSFEPLEDRRLLAVLTVNSLLDDTTPGDGLVTLREAIAAANADSATDLGQSGFGLDTITFAVGQSGAINLSSIGDIVNGPSALLVTSEITVQAGAHGITIQREAAASEMRLFRVTSNGSLTLESMMLAGGIARGPAASAVGEDGSEGRGGAIYNEGTLRIFSSTLYNNLSIGGAAGPGGHGGPGRGGAVYNYGGSVSFRNSTFSGNTAMGGAASILPSYGGTIYVINGSLTIHNSTLTGNTGDAGRGVYVLADGAGNTSTLILRSSIIANSGPPQARTDLAVIPANDGIAESSGGNNIIRHSVGFDGTYFSDEPHLDPLADNGGPTLTHALQSDSPALDQGSNFLSILTDQRGSSYARDVGDDVDIGAFERQADVSPQFLGDYNGDQLVDAADYVVWRHTIDDEDVEPNQGADGSGNGVIDDEDYDVWQENFGDSESSLMTSSDLPPAALTFTSLVSQTQNAVPTARATIFYAAPTASRNYSQQEIHARPLPRSVALTDGEHDQALLALLADHGHAASSEFSTGVASKPLSIAADLDAVAVDLVLECFTLPIPKILAG